MSLISEAGDSTRLIKYLKDAIPLGERPTPHAEWVSVRLDALQAAIDYIEQAEEFRRRFDQSVERLKANNAKALASIGQMEKIIKEGRTGK
ncbi:hypothetical protein [Rhodoferax mekongensis]|uniref:Uncharacterized protein n=1 Tax=Rhodoferax mekongensis TaxID=3068341 RepID=A0ABZ0B3G9_9BURK|nr:hypothetical protein [Rhodoferax sp. TBRC 17307]WNO06003.1 hypothetical protein RAN89_06125 [Rhodoferax sp. TBRC 17307]